jgi:hypothetical protein
LPPLFVHDGNEYSEEVRKIFNGRKWCYEAYYRIR